MASEIEERAGGRGSSGSTNGRVESTERSGEELILPADSSIDPTLSVVMPTLNEEAGIGHCIERIRAAVEELGVYAEIVVSDSSDDRTPEIAASMGAIVLEPEGLGYGYAYRYAFERCRGDYIAMGDADTTYDFGDIPELFDLVSNGDADMAMGSRLRGEIRDGSMPPLHRYVGNPFLTRFLNVFYGAGVSDAHSGLRVFTRAALEEMDLETDGMEFASEMIMKAGARGLTIEEIPIVYHEREGEEKLDSLSDGWRHVRFMLVNAPGYLFSIPGVMLGLVGVFIMGVVYGGVSIGSAAFGTNSLIAGSLLVILGTQVASLGVFSAVASDPIRRPTDRITTWLADHVTLEQGAGLGLALYAAGAVYATVLITRWIASGFAAVPTTASALVAFTTIVIGVQTIFFSFFLGSIR
jgi:glycosyltransferase involved in cell wall biosynthesis